MMVDFEKKNQENTVNYENLQKELDTKVEKTGIVIKENGKLRELKKVFKAKLESMKTLKKQVSELKDMNSGVFLEMSGKIADILSLGDQKREEAEEFLKKSQFTGSNKETITENQTLKERIDVLLKENSEKCQQIEKQSLESERKLKDLTIQNEGLQDSIKQGLEEIKNPKDFSLKMSQK